MLARLLIVILALLLARPAAAESYEEAVQALGEGSYKDRVAAVEALAALGDSRAVPVLEALMDRRLLVLKDDGRLVLEREGDEVLLDPVTLEPIPGIEGAKTKKVKVNNSVRGAIRGALGGLQLMAPDPERRAAAAAAVFKTPSAELLPALDAALAQERDSGVHDALTRARAATILAPDDASDADMAAKLEAVETLAGFPDREVKDLLSAVAAGENETLAAAANDVLAGIERSLALWNLVGDLFRGVSLGSVLLLAAIGLAITFGVMGVINMAHGEMVMLGAYTTFVVQEAFREHLPAGFDWSLAVAVPAAFLVAGAAGVVIERGVIRFLYGRPLETLLATWGLSLVLQQAVRTIFGPTNREVGNPEWMSGAMEVGSLVLTYNRIWIIAFSLAVLFGLMALMRLTAFGLQLRAVTQNRRMAGSMGIRTGRVDALTFGLGSGIAGMAGVALSQIDNVSPNLGQAYIIDSFLVVVFGGVGNLWGTLVGALSLGIVNKFLEPWAGAVLGKILVLVLIILFIQKRPRGLFALKGRAVES